MHAQLLYTSLLVELIVDVNAIVLSAEMFIFPIDRDHDQSHAYDSGAVTANVEKDNSQQLQQLQASAAQEGALRQSISTN
jgi:hypothetical protein